jgi:putative transcriptional regulator
MGAPKRTMLAPSAGRFLVAAPGLMDPNFHRTVVLLCRHDREAGSLGFVLNRKLPVTIGMAAPDLLADREEPLWLGGPVEPRSLWLLHSRADLDEPGERVTEGLFFGCESGLVRRVLSTSGPDQESRILRLLAGYAGWAKGQLDAEIEEGAWVVLPGGAATVFSGAPDDFWAEMWARTLLPGRLDDDLLGRARRN